MSSSAILVIHRDEMNMEQDNQKTILYGIRKIEWGAYGSKTAFPICVKAVSEYLGDDVSYAVGKMRRSSERHLL